MRFAPSIFLVFGVFVDAVVCFADERPPNILFVMVDDLGARDLGCYGSDYYRTPNLDDLAAEGIRFTRAYSAASVCSPTRASVLTGRYPHRIHLTDALPWDRLHENPKMVPPNHIKELPQELPTFANALQEAGYRTALFGKWHLGNEWQFFSEGKHLEYGFDVAADCSGREKMRDKGVDELTRFAVEFIQENKDNPFLLCLMHHVPHVPVASPPEAEAIYDGVVKGRFQKNQGYAGMVSHLDQSIQTLLDELVALGLEDDTMVVFTSDNGGLMNLTSNQPWRGGKGNLYEGGLRVPLIIRWPGNVSPGSVSESMVMSSDFFPTFREVAGLPPMPDAHVDGSSLMPILRGDSVPPRTLYWHFPHRNGPSSAMIEGDWKLVHKIVSDQYELFDLEADPAESNNVARTHPEEVERLANRLQGHLQSSSAQLMRPNPDWDPDLPIGKVRNFGIFYPAGGGTYQVVDEPLPKWFDPPNEPDE